MSSVTARYLQLFVLISMMLASVVFSRAAEQRGTVQSGRTPIAFSHITLYSAGHFQGVSPTILGTTQSGANGAFTVTFTQPTSNDTVLYLIADGGSPASGRQDVDRRSEIRLATVLDANSTQAGVVVNERSTVASAYAMAQFIAGPDIAGKSPGPQNAAAILRNLVDLSTGDVGLVLGNAPNGLLTTTMREFNSLANLLATCVNASTPEACNSLFRLATPPGGKAPHDTLQAAVNIAHYPWQNVRRLFLHSQLVSVYAPTLVLAPDAWTLAIRYEGNGFEFDGPGNMAVDKDGNVWITNNYDFSLNPFQSVCGGTQILKLTPTGSDAPGAPYSGGGLYGAGFGITLDLNGDLWVGNFGFQGKGCPLVMPNNSVSKVSSDGSPLSLSTGYVNGQISQPQGMATDQQGNVWIGNCGSHSVTQYPGGDPGNAKNFHDIGLSKPFGLAVDANGNAWIASNGNDSLVGLAPDGTPVPGSPFSGAGISAPLGVAVDSLGNVWVANSGVIELPCEGSQGGIGTGRASITVLSRQGDRVRSSAFTGGGITVPWGINVDGNDHVRVANFGGQRLSEFCGARPSTCPPGYRTGDPISPATGYTSDALTRNTGVVIDPSGNVWLANNWQNIPLQTNPGGHAVVVFIGLASPVKSPMIGPPQQP